MSSVGHNSICVLFDEKPWDQIKSIAVDREGEYTYLLKSRTDRSVHRLMCEVTVQDNVKVVTLRSTFKVENLTLYPIEVALLSIGSSTPYLVEKIGL